MAHPHLERRRQAREQLCGAVFHLNLGVAVFAPGAGTDFAAKMMNDVMKAVADAEDWHIEREKCWIGGRRVGVIDRRGTAGENDAERLESVDFAQRDGAGKNDGKDVLFAGAARYELGVLRAEVEDYDCLGVHFLLWQGMGRDVKNGRLPCEG